MTVGTRAYARAHGQPDGRKVRRARGRPCLPIAALGWMLSGAVLNPWMEGWTFETWTDRSEATHPEVSADGLAAVATKVEALGEHARVVDLGERRTYFLPAVGGRLSLYEFEGQDRRFDFTHDEAADPAKSNLIAAALQ